MKTIQLTPETFWIGKVDDRKVPFHRLVLEKGTTYNSYFINTDKPTIIDTVDIAYGKEYVDNLAQIINPEDIAYIVINHVEPDHAGALPALAARARNAKIVATELGVELLKDMFKLHNRDFVVARDGDTLDIGGKTLKFLETPYLHTEETMITYAVEDSVLYPCDLFSTHIATYELFNDMAQSGYTEDFNTYYKLIMHPHRPYVRKMLDKIRNLDIKVIAPSHGYILRENPESFIRAYDEMSDTKNSKSVKKVVVAYSTMTGNTAKIAQKMIEGLNDLGVETFAFNLRNANLNEVRKKVAECDGFLAGSSTRYADMVGNIEELLGMLKGQKFKNKLAAAFGSYGWSGEAVAHIEDYLNKAGFNIINQGQLVKSIGLDEPMLPLKVKFAREGELRKAEEAGKVFGERLLAS